MKPSEYFELDRPRHAWPKAAPAHFPYNHRPLDGSDPMHLYERYWRARLKMQLRARRMQEAAE